MSAIKRLEQKMNGIFYTPKECAQVLAKRIVNYYTTNNDDLLDLKIFDPMVGSGELLISLIEELFPILYETYGDKIIKELPNIIYAVDKDRNAVDATKKNISNFFSNILKKDISPSIFNNIVNLDALNKNEIEDMFPEVFSDERHGFSIIIANPPWEIVTINDMEFFSIYNDNYSKFNKDERIELKNKYLSIEAISDKYNKYTNEILNKKAYIKQHYKLGQNRGQVNLYRASLERILELCQKNGIIGIITPSGLAGERGAYLLRQELLYNNKILEMWSFSIGARLFPDADVSPLFSIIKRGGQTTSFPFLSNLSLLEFNEINIDELPRINASFIKTTSPEELSFTPIKSIDEYSILKKMYYYPKVLDKNQGLWNIDVGREFDETNDRKYYSINETKYVFLKGRDVTPFKINYKKNLWIDNSYPKSSTPWIKKERIVWRDIARANKKRRMFATIVPKNTIVGNSLNYFKEELNRKQRRYLLGVWSSLVIEYRIRQLSTNNHLNMYVTRQIPIPRLKKDDPYFDKISKVTKKLLKNYDTKQMCILEALVASLYKLNKKEFKTILSTFPKISDEIKLSIINEFERIQVIQNHDTATLSDLDLQMIKYVPEGGNWKNIPESVPSKRVQQIRTSYKQGKGSRSTYYGRLNRDKPAYTISTYFGRPGNGCNLHPVENRTISAREAARIQSFPDWFYFQGKSRRSISMQVGNAVPPLLAYAIAKEIPPGNVIDLFSGAGGLSLGFHLAGHSIFLATDIVEEFLNTHSINIPSTLKPIVGDIREKGMMDSILDSIKEEKVKIHTIIGGPPCQGYSEAGNKRSIFDPRNNLYKKYIEMVEKIKPNSFVMENVPGLLTINKGSFFKELLREFTGLDYRIKDFTLWAHEYGVPQKRKRVFIVGVKERNYQIPKQIFSSNEKSLLPNPIPVREVFVNLPRKTHGSWNNSRNISYSKPASVYNRWLRGQISVDEMISHYVNLNQKESNTLERYFQ